LSHRGVDIEEEVPFEVNGYGVVKQHLLYTTSQMGDASLLFLKPEVIDD